MTTITSRTTDPVELMAAMRLEDGRLWGEVATDWQLADARAVLSPRLTDPVLHWLGRPKGGSKSTDVAGLVLVWLLVQAAALDEGYVIASDQEQAARLLKRAAGLISRTPGLSDRLEVQTNAIVNRRNEAKVVALAADAAGTEGIVAPIIMVDELPQWLDTRAARAMWDAAYSSIPKVPGMRFVVIGHAGIRGSWQERLFDLFTESPLWRVNDVAGPLPWIDPAILADQKATLLPGQFARRHLNQWSEGADTLASFEALQACVTLTGPMAPAHAVEYVVAVDLGLKNDRTVAVVAHVEEQLEVVGGRDESAIAPRRVVLDRMQVWQGSRLRPVNVADVETWLLQAASSFNGAPVVFDPWQMVGTSQRLQERGVDVEEFTFSSASVGRLASTLHQLIRDGALALPDDEELLDELAHVRLIERSPGVVRMDHDSGRHDDRAQALALAAVHLLNRPAAQPRQMMTSFDYRTGRSDVTEFGNQAVEERAAQLLRQWGGVSPAGRPKGEPLERYATRMAKAIVYGPEHSGRRGRR